MRSGFVRESELAFDVAHIVDVFPAFDSDFVDQPQQLIGIDRFNCHRFICDIIEGNLSELRQTGDACWKVRPLATIFFFPTFGRLTSMRAIG